MESKTPAELFDPAYLFPPAYPADALAWRHQQAASHPGASAAQLDQLARRTFDGKTLVLIVRHPSVSPDTLRHLSQSAMDWVRAESAKSLACPVDVLVELVRDGATVVNEAALSHPATPMDKVLRFAFGMDAKLALAAARNPALPVEALVQLAKAKDWQTREAVAWNIAAPEKAMDLLAKDRSWKVREVLARHPRLPVRLQEVLKRDRHPSVSSGAERARDPDSERPFWGRVYRTTMFNGL